jgi:hypothetical protein
MGTFHFTNSALSIFLKVKNLIVMNNNQQQASHVL